MKYVRFEQALEAQVGGVFYNFTTGSHSMDDDIADIIVANYHDRGASFGTLSDESEPLPLPEAEVGESERPGEPDAETPVPDAPSTRRSRARSA